MEQHDTGLPPPQSRSPILASTGLRGTAPSRVSPSSLLSIRDGFRDDDLRRARGRRTRTLVVEAFTDLAASGILRPTARQIAQRAGVSVRLLFHHFQGIDGVASTALLAALAVHEGDLVALPCRGDRAVRVASLCRQRRDYFEALLPLHRATAARQASDPSPNPALTSALSADRLVLRQQLVATFRPEFDHSPNSVLLDVIDHATGWQNWLSLRHDYSAPAAERIMAATALHLLPPSPSPPAQPRSPPP